MKKNIKNSLYGFVCLLIVVSLVIIFFKNKSTNNQNDDIKEISKNNPIEKEVVSVSDENVSYRYKHYTYEIPNGIDFNPSELTFKLNDNNNWEAIISIMYDNDRIVKNNPEKIKTNLIKNEYNVENIGTTLIGLNQYVVITCNKNAIKHVIAYRPLEEKYAYEIDITGNHTDEALEIIDIILNNAIHDGEDTKYYYYSF